MSMHAGQQMEVPALTASWPQPLLELATAAWRASVQRSPSLSKFHEEVSRVLWRMGVLHRNAHILGDGLFCVNVALEGDKVSVLMRSSVLHS